MTCCTHPKCGGASRAISSCAFRQGWPHEVSQHRRQLQRCGYGGPKKLACLWCGAQRFGQKCWAFRRGVPVRSPRSKIFTATGTPPQEPRKTEPKPPFPSLVRDSDHLQSDNKWIEVKVETLDTGKATRLERPKTPRGRQVKKCPT